MFKVKQENVSNILRFGEVKEPIIVTLDDQDIAVIISLEDFDELLEAKKEKEILRDFNNPHIRIMTDGKEIKLNYSDYVKLREELLKAFDKAFMPDPEKLN